MAEIFTNFALFIPHLLLHFILTMSNIIHPLHTDIQPPKQFTFPFCYTPHPLCELAAEAVQHYIRTSGCMRRRGWGKDVRVLVVRNEAAGRTAIGERWGCGSGALRFPFAAYSRIAIGSQ